MGISRPLVACHAHGAPLHRYVDTGAGIAPHLEGGAEDRRRDAAGRNPEWSAGIVDDVEPRRTAQQSHPAFGAAIVKGDSAARCEPDIAPIRQRLGRRFTRAGDGRSRVSAVPPPER